MKKAASEAVQHLHLVLATREIGGIGKYVFLNSSTGTFVG
jgi:hypothetical protein